MDVNAAEYRIHRKALGLTQAQLADLLGVSRDTIITREAGRSRLIGEHFLALKALDLDNENFLGLKFMGSN